MDNFIYLCWIQLWTMSFHYQIGEEKKYWFQELLKVLDRVKTHEIELINSLFECVSKRGEDYMALKIYERIIHYNISPSYSILTTINRLIDKINSKNKVPQSIQSIIQSINMVRIFILNN